MKSGVPRFASYASSVVGNGANLDIPAGRTLVWFACSQTGAKLQISTDGGSSWVDVYQGDTPSTMTATAARAWVTRILSNGSNVRILNIYAGNNTVTYGYEI